MKRGPKIKDLSGQRFCYLTVLSLAEKEGRSTLWNAICVCGTQIKVRSNGLLTGHSKSCSRACFYRQAAIQRIGQKYGRLLIIAVSNQTNASNDIHYECRCDCGGTKVASWPALSLGKIKCCSHECSHKYKAEQLIGQKFGRLQVLAINGKTKFNNYKCDCLCECGKQITTAMGSLIKGEARSCGCINIERLKTMAGSRNPAWKGGVTQQNLNLRRTEEYKRWTTAIRRKFKHTCQKCGTEAKTNYACHHILGFADYPTLRYEPNNGILFCKPCHLEFHKIYGQRGITRIQVEEFIGKQTTFAQQAPSLALA